MKPEYRFFDNLLEGCQIISPNWEYVYVNETTAKQAKVRRTDLIGQKMMDVFPGIDKTAMFATLRKCMASKVSGHLENEFTFPDGTRGWFELYFEPVPEGIFIFSLDITEKKFREFEQTILLEILDLTNKAVSWEMLLGGLLELTQKWSKSEAVAIRVREGDDYPVYRSSGYPEKFLHSEKVLGVYDKAGKQRFTAKGKPQPACFCGEILFNRPESEWISHTEEGSFWCNHLSDYLGGLDENNPLRRLRKGCFAEGFESIAMIPIRTGKEMYGFIQLSDEAPMQFTSQQIHLYERVARRAANFIARKRRDEQINHLNAILKGIRNVNQLITHENDPSQLIRKACELLVESRGFNSVIIGLMDEKTQHLQEFASAGFEPDYLKQAFEQNYVPQCVREAMETHEIILTKLHREQCADCPVAESVLSKIDDITLTIEQNNKIYGFMIVSLPKDMGDLQEEQDLLREVTEDLGFALWNQEIQTQRDEAAHTLKETENQLRQLQKMESIGRLAGGIAHDFNNILGAQIGYCDLLEMQMDSDNPILGDFGKIRACAERATALTRQLLAFSRKQPLDVEVLNLNQVVSEIESLLRRTIGEDINLIVKLAEDLGSVAVDRSQIEQVIMNLVVNARDAMDHGGRLIIATENVDIDESYVEQHLEVAVGPHVVLTVTDSGIGMPAEIREKIFEPFFTTKPKDKGTGLGLSTVYGIVKQSGGNIWVYSAPGEGTTFKIYLPRVESRPATKRKSTSQTRQGAGELILVVEDEPELREIFAFMIGRLGYAVKTASSGSEALAMLESEKLTPDLLITDVVMPGMSGKTLADKVHESLPGLPVLYTSGYTDEAIVKHGVLDPEISFLPKPFTLSRLSEKISQILQGENE